MFGLYTILSLLAVLALAAFNWWLGRGGKLAKAKMTASQRIRLDLIDFDEVDGEEANDGNAYIAQGGRDKDIAIAVFEGDGWIVRRLGDVAGLEKSGATLALFMKDFTFPRATLTFKDEARAQYWAAQLALLVRNEVEETTNGLAKAG